MAACNSITGSEWRETPNLDEESVDIPLRCHWVDDAWIDNHAVQRPGASHLDLANCKKVSRKGFTSLLKFKRLSELSLKQTNISDSDLALLHDLPITKLNLYGCAVSDVGLVEVANLKRIEKLNLLECENITESGVASLLQKTRLKSLSIEFDKLGANIERLPPTLTSLSLTGSGEISQATADALVRLPILESIQLTKGIVVKKDSLQRLLEKPWREFNLGNAAAFDNDAMEQLCSKSSGLQSLSINNATSLDDSGIKHISKLNMLREIDIKGSSQITKLYDYLRSPLLETVFIIDCVNLSRNDSAKYRASHPGVVIVDFIDQTY